MELTFEMYIYIFFIQIIAFVVKGMAGFGDPLVSSSGMSLFMQSKNIAPFTLCLCLPTNAYYSWKNRKHLEIKKLIPIIAAIMCGTIPGTLILANAPSDVIKAVLGVVIIAAGIEMATRINAKQKKYNKYTMYIISFFSGVSGGLYGIAFFYVAYLERTTADRHSFRGSVCFIFLFENIFRMIVYGFSGLLTTELIYMLLAAIPGVLIGMFIAKKLDPKVSERAIRIFVIVVFIAGGISALANAIFVLFN